MTRPFSAIHYFAKIVILSAIGNCKTFVIIPGKLEITRTFAYESSDDVRRKKLFSSELVIGY